MGLVSTRSRFWGPLWPDLWGVAARPFWGRLFPDPGPELDRVAGIGPAGVATFVLDLESTLKLTLDWNADGFKSYDGSEKRTSVLDDPRRRFDGPALLIGSDSVRITRAQLARYASIGAAFSLGLPYESLLLTADSIGATVNVAGLTQCDWANPGQRVVVVGNDRSAVTAVVQSASGTTIRLDVSPGAAGSEGSRIMPTVPIYLDPQQGFARYPNPEGIERWSISATAALFGYQKAPVKAVLRLDTSMGVPDPGSGVLEGITLQAREAGIAGNDIRVSLDDESLSGVDISETGTDVEIHYQAGVSTVGDLVAAINASSALIKAIGTWTPSDMLVSDDDEFDLAFMDGGSDGDYASDGQGATVVTHASRPIYNRGLAIRETAGDSLQAMNEIVSLGGIPANVGQVSTSDWGRQIAIEEADQAGEWQWLKRFLATVRGRQRAFWLPTWRNDLTAVSSGVGTLTIENDGHFFTWYPPRTDIQIRQENGSITYATISAAVDNGDGTITLTTGVTLSGSPIAMVSWLELCRLEDNEIAVTFDGGAYSMQTTARVVTR